jgi:membrane protein DedA with SNARE-associated domain
MALPRFVLFTGLGALLWCTILATIGYVLGQHEEMLRNADVQREVSRALVYLIPALIVTVIVYAWRQRRRGTTKTP